MQNKASFWSGLDDTVNTAVSLFSGGFLGGGETNRSVTNGLSQGGVTPLSNYAPLPRTMTGNVNG